MRRLTTLIVCCFVMLLYVPAQAHQDTMLELENGRILGLPEQFQLAFFDTNDLALQIGMKRLEFPSCVENYFAENKDYKVYLTASWYHDLNLIPPYIVIHLESPDRDFTYELVFLMKTLMPFDFGGISRQSGAVDFTDSCIKDIEKNISTIGE